MIDLDNVLSEIMLRLADIIIQGGNTPQKIVVSEKVYKLLIRITTMPRSVRYENSQFFIADIPVEKGKLDSEKNEGVWFQIV